tara:strand:+ start:938 stop:1804 length:867 start_codon:yes stop_codon:yes gene_type:complete
MEKQELLETTFSRRGLMTSLKDDVDIKSIADLVFSIEGYLNTQYSYDSKNARVSEIVVDSLDIAYHLAANIMRCNGVITPIQSICTSMAPLLNSKLLDGVRTASEIIAVCEGKLYDLLAHDYEDNPTGTLAVEPKLIASLDVLSRIEEFMFIPPLVIPPKKWLTNKGGGLHTQQESCILGKHNYHKNKQALDCLNILQDIEWELDPKIMQLKEEPNKSLDTSEKVIQFKIMRITSSRVYKEYSAIPFYFMWKFDKRGRMYSSGYHINFQSTDYKKALLSFTKQEVITL